MHHHHLKRHLLNRAAALSLSKSDSQPWIVEQLEQRRLLSGGVFDASNVPAFVPTSADINDPKNGPLANFGSNLVGVYSEYKKFIRTGGSPKQFVSKADSVLDINKDRVAITLRTRGTLAKLSDRIHAFGGELIIRNSDFKTADAWVPISQLSSLAR